MKGDVRVVNWISVSGERFSSLLDDYGFPDWWSSLWVVDKLRRSGLAANTISTKLRAVQCLYQALPIAADFTPRLARGEWFTVAEADHLLEQMAYPTQLIQPFDAKVRTLPSKTRERNLSLEKVRSKLKAEASERLVNTNTKFRRILFIREFLDWRANEQILRLRSEKKFALINAVAEFDSYLESRTTKFRSASALGSPQGLAKNQQDVLLEVIKPEHPQNPWKNDKFIRARNQAIVELMLLTGPRRGGVLGMQVGDLDPLTGRISIIGRKDDPSDPRPVQTGNKRKDYLITLGHRVLTIYKAYLVQRHKVLVKRRINTSYAIISSGGHPLEQSSLNYIFRSLRVIPELANIHPHLLRHTWASNFIDDAVARGDDLDTIEHDLKTLGGWSDRSDMPAHYTSRYRCERSFESSLKLQEKAVPMSQSSRKKPA